MAGASRFSSFDGSGAEFFGAGTLGGGRLRDATRETAPGKAVGRASGLCWAAGAGSRLELSTRRVGAGLASTARAGVAGSTATGAGIAGSAAAVAGVAGSTATAGGGTTGALRP